LSMMFSLNELILVDKQYLRGVGLQRALIIYQR
jgi:hypothetical protein